MLKVSSEAIEQIRQYFLNKDRMPIRIFVAMNCSGAQFALALDESITNSDIIKKIDGFDFVVDTNLSKEVGDITIDFINNQFIITSEKQITSQINNCCGNCSCQ